MKRLIIVAASAIAMVVFVLLHLYAGALSVGIVVGTFFFLAGMSKGGSVAQVRITADPGKPRKPADPNNSIGLGLAASGIASTLMLNMHYPTPFRIFYVGCFIAGLLIALGYAGKTAFGSRTSASQSTDGGGGGGGDQPTDTIL